MIEFTPAPIAPTFTLAALSAGTADPIAAITAATGSAPSETAGKTGAPATSWWDQVSHNLLHGMVVAPIKAIAATPAGQSANDVANLASGNWVTQFLSGAGDLASRLENEIMLGAIALAFITGGILWIASSQAPAIEDAAGKVAKVAAVAA